MVKFEGHNLVLGATGTGKGMLVASKARAAQRAGLAVYLLCNKQHEYDTFPADFKTMDQARLMEEVLKLDGSRKTIVAIDEAWDWKWKGDGGLQAIPNAARALGVEMWVQSQFPTQMPPTVRGNCDNIYCFYLREVPAIKWAAEAYGETFRRVNELKPGRYIGQRGLGSPFLGCSWYTDGSGKFHSA